MKTFIGELILRLQTPGADKAKKLISTLKDVDKAARNVGKGGSRGLSKMQGQMAAIERHAKSLAKANWGVSYQRQLERLGLSKREFQAVGKSWNRLQTNIRTNNMKKSLKASNISAWKTATLSHFAQVRAGMKTTQSRARALKKSLQFAARPFMVAAGGYTGAYMLGIVGRAAGAASADRQREGFRQRTVGMPEKTRSSITGDAVSLGQKYPSLSLTQIMEIGRLGAATMGSYEKVRPLMNDLTRFFVAMQSSRGLEVGATVMQEVLKSLDNLGKNEGPDGVKNIKELLDAFARSSQFDPDFKAESMVSFTRRSKIAGPGLSNAFISLLSTIIGDLGAATAGKSFSSAYMSYVIGAGNAASKKARTEQVRLGLRKDIGKGSLVKSDLYSENPYEWTKQVMIPALVKSGVDINNSGAVAKAVALTTNNSITAAVLTKLITQRFQIERDILARKRAMGLSAADEARTGDPYIAGRGLTNSLRNLSAAVGEHTMPGIVSGLNSLTNTINTFSEAVRKGDPTVTNSAMAIGGAAGAYGLYKGVKGIRAIFLAGPALLSSAAALEAAAVSLGGGAVGGSGAKGKSGPLGWLAAGAAAVASTTGAIIASMSTIGGSAAQRSPAGEKQFQAFNSAETSRFRMDKYGPAYRQFADSHGGAGYKSPFVVGSSADERKRLSNYANGLKDALAIPKTTPVVDTSSIDRAADKAHKLKAILDGIASSASSAGAKVNSELQRSFSDYGVAP